MIAVQPTAPWRDTYETTAIAIASNARISPLFEGKHGVEKTAALLVSLAWFESHLKPDAEGDHRCLRFDGKKCVQKGPATSFCLLQVSESNFAAMGVKRADVQSDINVCVRTGLRLAHVSFGVCRSLPLEDRLRHYAGGGDGCPTNEDAAKKSKHRFNKGRWIFEHNKPTW